MMQSQTSSWCSAKNVVVVILVYSAVISYVIYDFYFTDVVLSHIIGGNGQEEGEALQERDKNKDSQHAHTEYKNDTKIGANKVPDATTRTTAPSRTTSSSLRSLQETNSDSKIEVYGSVENGKKYAVFGCNTPTDNDYTYPFLLPLTVLAWRRVYYSSIVIIAGTKEYWTKSKILKVVLNELQSLNVVLIFIHSNPDNALMLSQVSRLFLPLLVPWTAGDKEPYLVTSDADIWPISATLYDLMPGTKIVSSNSECCGYFNHNGQNYKMLPMCFIGMKFSTWAQVMKFDPGQTLNSSNDIIEYVAAEFGEFVRQKVSKGENSGWFLDQHLVSVRIQQWALRNAADLVDYIRRDTGADRVDRSFWNPHNIAGKKDSHLILSSYKPGIWERLLPLMHQLFNKTTMAVAEGYRESFLQKLYRSQETT